MEDLSALQELFELTALHLLGTCVRDLSPLRQLTNLTTLSIHDTQVTDLSALEDLPNLTTLYFDCPEANVPPMFPERTISPIVAT